MSFSSPSDSIAIIRFYRAGWWILVASGRAGRLVEESESIEFDGVAIRVERVENTRIMKARLSRVPEHDRSTDAVVEEAERSDDL